MTPDPFPVFWRGRLTLVLCGFLGTNGAAGATVALRFGDSVEFNLNSMYDTALTTSSRQPQYFSTFQNLYKRYRVKKTHLDLVFQNNYASPVMVGMHVEPPGNAGVKWLENTLVENAATLPYTSLTPLSASAGQSIAKISKTFDMAQICGLTRQQFDANVEEYAAIMTASPTRIPVLEIAVANMITTSSDIISYTATFGFDCEFFDRVL